MEIGDSAVPEKLLYELDDHATTATPNSIENEKLDSSTQQTNCCKQNWFEFQKHCLTKYNPLPTEPTLLENLRFKFLCPPHGCVARGLLFIVLILLVFGVLWGITGEQALPGGNFFSLLVLFLCCSFGGFIVEKIKLPSLLGMLLAGFALRNIPKLEVAENIDTNWSGALRSIALTIILIVAGLGLDPVALRRLSFGVLRLAFTPCIVETCTVAVSSHFLLDLPWSYAFILGFVLSAVSPAVVVPSLLSLTERGYGVEKGIPTLVIAAASVDDVICITGFGIALGITFSTGNLVLVAFKGPIEAVVGILYGIIVGVVLWYIPHANHKSKLLFRFLLMISSGLFALFGSQRANISGAGPLAVLTLAFVAQLKWRKETDQAKEMSKIFEILWAIFKPLLFGLIGAEVYLEKIQPAKVGIGLAVLGIGLVLRMAATFLAVFGNSLNMKEKLFTTVSWIPKATVQAAIGGVALDTARAKSAPESEIEVALQIVTIAALAIVVTAPIGAILISLLGPRLLQKSSPRGDEVLVEPELYHPAEKTLLEENHKVNDISSV